MAFTQAPAVSTYKTQRFPMVGSPQQRDGNTLLKDQRFLNCFAEMIKTTITDGKKYYVKKRGGLRYVTSVVPGAGRGILYEPTNNKLYFVVGTTLYLFNVSTTVLTSIATVAGGINQVGMTIHIANNVRYIVALDGASGFVINAATDVMSTITSPNFPTPHVPMPVSLDGYLFVAKAQSEDIYNSNLDDPFTWTPGDFISAEMYPDNILALTKNNNYIYAVGTSSVELFWDAAIANGSPLQRNDSTVQQFGTTAPNTVVQTEKEVVLIGTTQNGGRTVWLIEGFKSTEVGIEPVKQSLDDQGDHLNEAFAYCVRSMGHKWYVLRLRDRTWVYDFDEQLWSEWSTTNAFNIQITFSGMGATDSPYGEAFILDIANGGVFLMDQNHYQDDVNVGVVLPIYMQMTTTKVDFDNMNRKDFYRFSIYGDWPGDATSANIVLDWSDDDYRTWHGARNINLIDPLPRTRRLGKSRRRAFRLTYTENLPIRLEGFELDVNIGQT